VADRRRERIGGIRRDRSFEFQDILHHQLHLRLLCTARPDHGQFNLSRGVLENFGLGIRRSANRRAARLTELQRAIGIAIHENPLDRDFLRLIIRDDGLHAPEYLA
jgi:hypothetical protein